MPSLLLFILREFFSKSHNNLKKAILLVELELRNSSDSNDDYSCWSHLAGEVLDTGGVENFWFLETRCQNIQGLVIFSSYQWRLLLLEWWLGFKSVNSWSLPKAIPSSPQTCRKADLSVASLLRVREENHVKVLWMCITRFFFFFKV